ncbi:OLC1v1022462C1 [Oldenlandia corymbosa var. corymbosa]|uniref:OLC1v1022462C1 n=1 Tax=Oldenlandia corymbosa var. corymbosa TaxID=529605 RepID=A0AAV1C0A3_OLDCO|nr:OLC1v1022462C1 [Oldenlandia corymbosa var. corymbosa]
MASEKIEEHHQHLRVVKNEEEESTTSKKKGESSNQSEREENEAVSTRLKLIGAHTYRREPTIDANNYDDGSSNVTEKCHGISQQAHHSKCA